jgi:hypothetical protein
MMGGSVANDTDPNARVVKPLHEAADRQSLPSASEREPGSREEPTYDAAWTARMLNSMAAWRRRDRRLVRDADSAGRGYVAYHATARPANATEGARMDRGTVEIADGESARWEQDQQRLERAATTIVLARRRSSGWLALAVLLAGLGTAGVIWAGRMTDRWAAHKRPANVTASALPQPTATAPAALPPVSTENDRDLAAPIGIGSAQLRTMTATPRREPPMRSHPAVAPAPAPAMAVGADAGDRPFVDVVNRY